MAEQRIDGFVSAGDPVVVTAGAPRGTDDRAGGFVAGQFGTSGSGITVQTYSMRAWSALLGHYVIWIATILDSAGAQAPAESGVLTDVVWLRTN